MDRAITKDEAARLRASWRKAYSSGWRTLILDPGERIEPLSNDLYGLICRAQDRFRAPHERWQWVRPQPPMPFCWGAQGPLLLLLGMLASYGAAIAALLMMS
jgi:hypothetical protein